MHRPILPISKVDSFIKIGRTIIPFRSVVAFVERPEPPSIVILASAGSEIKLTTKEATDTFREKYLQYLRLAQ